MTPMNNADYLTRLEHADELEALKAAKKASGLTYEQLAELIGVNKVWPLLYLKDSSMFRKNIP